MRSGVDSAADLESKTLRDFPPSRNYLIGVSGGRDSVALFHWLVRYGYRKLVVCHLEHGIRGKTGRADARFVERLARKLSVPVAIASANVPALAARNKQSIETAARTARYEFFAKVARKRRCHTIFLGHHADDLVETFLINLFRGAGTSGLTGMREISTRKVGATELEIVRPLLGIWREQIDQYVKRHRLKFREDASNRDLAPLRNRLRHRVIPFLEKELGRNIRASIGRAAMIMAEEENFFAELFPPDLSQLAVEQIRVMPLTMQRRALRDWMRTHHVPNVGFELVERVRALVEVTNRVAKTNLPGNRHARRRAGKLFIE